jgi:glutamyl-tRNA synthetase
MPHDVRVRFAPSPTGYLHVGGLRTALYNYLFARHHGGKLVLRIEDTDQTRKVEGAVENLINTLEWAGIDYDEGPKRGGSFGPYVQSERLEIYAEYAQRLLRQGDAYYCFCTPERLEQVRQQRLSEKRSPGYDRHCRDIDPDEARRRKESGEACVVRMNMPLEGEVEFDDLIRGRVSIPTEALDDQVILKSDGYPTYHLAVVVDDHMMEISHVIRGEEWLSSTPKHVLLYRFFGWELPQFAHLPLLLNPDKSKLSKRQGDVAVEEYRAKGYLKEAMVNFIAFLGWNPGDERELFSLEELVREFTLERVGKSGAVFNVEKLTWMNSQYLRMKPDAEVLALLNEELKASGIDATKLTDDYLLLVIGAMRERAAFVKDFVQQCPYFYGAPRSYDPDVQKKRWKPETAGHLKALSAEFSSLQNPSKQDYEASLQAVSQTLNVKPAELIHPLRLAVSGMGAGPGLYDILFILGKDETIRRIQSAVETLR